MEPLPKISDFYASAWNRKWAHVTRIAVNAVPGSKGVDSNAIYLDLSAITLEPGVPLNQGYVCYHGLREVARALKLPVGDGDDVLVVRPGYDELIERMVSGDLSLFNKVIVTGHPGTGKTMFLLYLLLWRMQRALPTVIQRSTSDCILFDESGFAVLKHTYLDDHAARLQNCWALTDSHNAMVEPNMELLLYAQRVIHTTSPNPERWTSWRKHFGAVLVIMHLPTPLDVAAVAWVHGYAPSEALVYLDVWGPSIRTIIYLLDRKLTESELRARVAKAASALCANDANASFIHLRSIDGVRDFEGRYSPLVFLRPLRLRCTADDSLDPTDIVIRTEGSDRIVEHRGLPSYLIPTDYLRNVFEDQRAHLSVRLSLLLHEALSPRSLTKSAVGWQHELRVHRRLCSDGRPLDVVGCGGQLQPANRLLPGTLSALKNIEANPDDQFYWIPSVVNFTGIDGMLVRGLNLYAIQATVATEHSSPKDGLRKLWDNMKPAVRHLFDWHLVFITRDHAPDAYVQTWSTRLSFATHARGKVEVKVWGCMLHEIDNSGPTEYESDGNSDGGLIDEDDG